MNNPVVWFEPSSFNPIETSITTDMVPTNFQPYSPLHGLERKL